MSVSLLVSKDLLDAARQYGEEQRLNLPWLEDMQLPEKWVELHKRVMASRETPLRSKFLLAIRNCICGMMCLSVPTGFILGHLYGAYVVFIFLGIVASLAHLVSLLLPKKVLVARWNKIPLNEYGWKNLPRRVRNKAKEIQRRIPCARLFVDALMLQSVECDPLLIVECYAREFYVEKWQ